MPAARLPSTERLLRALDGQKTPKSGGGWMARCPAHEDSKPSLSIDESPDRTVIMCMAGCETERIMRSVGLEMRDLFNDGVVPAAPPEPRARSGASQNGNGNGNGAKRGTDALPGALVAVYEYRDAASGLVTAEKGRFEYREAGQPDDEKPKKTFVWRRAGATGWDGLKGMPIDSLALWGVELLAERPADTVYFCEGEKATQACRDNGLLAVAHGGGASTRKFGASLEALRGRRVALWPDNDAAGREYAVRIHGLLTGVAAEVSILNVPLPPRGDAVEFFANGGTVAQLEQTAAPLDEASLTVVTPSHMEVTYPLPGNTAIHVSFTGLGPLGTALMGNMTLTLTGPGVDSTPYKDRFDLWASAERINLRKELQEIHGREIPWAKALNVIFAMVRERFTREDTSVDAFDLEPVADSDLFFHYPLIPKGQVTILFGRRASGKTYILETIMVSAAMGIPFLGQNMPVTKWLFLDYEDDEKRFRRRLDRICTGLGVGVLPGTIRYMRVAGMPLLALKERIQAVLEEDPDTVIALDSIGPAVGGDPSKAELAIPMMETLRACNTTVVALAHVPKNTGPERPTDPFGSGFYGNESRGMWYVEAGEGSPSDPDRLDVALHNAKISDGAQQRPIGVRIQFNGRSGPVRVTGQPMRDIPDLEARLSLWERIHALLLREGAMTAADIAGRLASPEQDVAKLEGTVASTLRAKRQTFMETGTAPARSGGGGRNASVWGVRTQNSWTV